MCRLVLAMPALSVRARVIAAASTASYFHYKRQCPSKTLTTAGYNLAPYVESQRAPGPTGSFARALRNGRVSFSFVLPSSVNSPLRMRLSRLPPLLSLASNALSALLLPL